MERRERLKKRQITSDWSVAGLISKDTYMRLVSGSPKMSRSPHPPCQSLKSLYRGLKCQSHIVSRWSQHITLSSQCPCSRVHCGQDKQNIHSKDRGRSGEAWIVWVQFMDQQAVMPSWWPPPTLYIYNVLISIWFMDNHIQTLKYSCVCCWCGWFFALLWNWYRLLIGSSPLASWMRGLWGLKWVFLPRTWSWID